MQKQKPRILVITPTKHIKDLNKTLESIGHVEYFNDPTKEEVKNIIKKFDAVFTNPNKSKVFLGKDVLENAKNLKIICTASTGTNHIDKKFAKEKGIEVLSITNERRIINSISSTAEHAFCLTLASIRNVNHSYNDVLKGNWDYTNFIGRQLNFLNIGVIGYGRLGKMYAHYCNAFGSKVFVFDPYKEVKSKKIKQLRSLEQLVKVSDIISIHVHVNDETINMLNENYFKLMKKNVLLVNTSRGEVINENDLKKFLELNPKAKFATDVLSDEILGIKQNIILNYAKNNKSQVLITPHIGGMTSEAQLIAYTHAANLLKCSLKKIKE